MVGTVLPIVYGERKRGKLPLTLWCHILGYLFGAAAIGGVLGALGVAFLWQAQFVIKDFPLFVATGLIGLVYSSREFGLVQVPVLHCTRQVPHGWRLVFSPRTRALCYGFALGLGLATRIPVSTFYVAAFWVTFSGSPLRSSLAMCAFGAGRALPIFLIDRRCDSGNQRRSISRGLSSWEPVVHLINGLALAGGSACLLVVWFMTR